MGCQLPTVNRFLFCLSLQTGGYVIGWLAAIFSVIGAIGLAATLVFVIIAGTSGEVDAEAGAIAGATVG